MLLIWINKLSVTVIRQPSETQSRSAFGSRRIVSMVQEYGEKIGRFKVRGLMRELELVNKQPGSHA
jgi:putative transposase